MMREHTIGDRRTATPATSRCRSTVGASTKTCLGTAVFLVLGSIPSTASAEVSDKALSIGDQWIIALPIAALALLLGCWRWWMTFPLGVLIGLAIFAEMEFLSDSFIRSALLQEQRQVYFISMFAADMHMVAGLVAGGFLGWKRRPTMGLHSLSPSSSGE